MTNMLTHADIRLLEFEDTHPRRTGLKNDAILHRLGMSPARYYQRLDQLVRQQAVQDRWPRLADRIERQNDRRRQERAQLRRWL
ncbi:uncharacterized protein DUF3263 [Amnibacterium kyonggiense]|uniref:Uncharacterized protein DUF3263 n=2 Tax=Amnibacterium kyonggiense TaxID=595671 RepID=A0A4R7FJE4_9MICO|nr:uncharacterized protein DUF3263 [Amnibacterium kyonggiense]